MFRGLLPVITQAGARVHYSIPPAARLLASAGALAVVAAGFLIPEAGGSPPRGLWWATAAVLALAAGSEDRWSFDTATREVRRRFGLVFAARRWSLSLDEAESFALIAGDPSDIGGRAAAARGAGPAPGSSLGERFEADELDQRERLAVSLQGLGRGPWVALVLRLSGDRMVVLAAARRRGGSAGRGIASAEAALRADGRSLGRLVGLPFLDSLEE